MRELSRGLVGGNDGSLRSGGGGGSFLNPKDLAQGTYLKDGYNLLYQID